MFLLHVRRRTLFQPWTWEDDQSEVLAPAVPVETGEWQPPIAWSTDPLPVVLPDQDSLPVGLDETDWHPPVVWPHSQPRLPFADPDSLPVGLEDDTWQVLHVWPVPWNTPPPWEQSEALPQLWLDDDPSWPPPLVWAAVPPWLTLQDADELPVAWLTEEAWRPPPPWPESVAAGWQVVDTDALPVAPVLFGLDDTAWAFPRGWTEALPRLWLGDGEEFPTPPVLFGLDETVWAPLRGWTTEPPRWVWGVEPDALPVSLDDEALWQPPRPWAVDTCRPWWDETETLPLLVPEEGDHALWLLPRPWSESWQALRWVLPEEWTPPAPVFGLDDEPWVVPPPWAVAPQWALRALRLLSSLSALEPLAIAAVEPLFGGIVLRLDAQDVVPLGVASPDVLRLRAVAGDETALHAPARDEWRPTRRGPP